MLQELTTMVMQIECNSSWLRSCLAAFKEPESYSIKRRNLFLTSWHLQTWRSSTKPLIFNICCAIEIDSSARIRRIIWLVCFLIVHLMAPFCWNNQLDDVNFEWRHISSIKIASRLALKADLGGFIWQRCRPKFIPHLPELQSKKWLSFFDP